MNENDDSAEKLKTKQPFLGFCKICLFVSLKQKTNTGC